MLYNQVKLKDINDTLRGVRCASAEQFHSEIALVLKF